MGTNSLGCLKVLSTLYWACSILLNGNSRLIWHVFNCSIPEFSSCWKVMLIWWYFSREIQHFRTLLLWIWCLQGALRHTLPDQLESLSWKLSSREFKIFLSLFLKYWCSIFYKFFSESSLLWIVHCMGLFWIFRISLAMRFEQCSWICISILTCLCYVLIGATLCYSEHFPKILVSLSQERVKMRKTQCIVKVNIVRP